MSEIFRKKKRWKRERKGKSEETIMRLKLSPKKGRNKENTAKVGNKKRNRMKKKQKEVRRKK